MQRVATSLTIVRYALPTNTPPPSDARCNCVYAGASSNSVNVDPFPVSTKPMTRNHLAASGLPSQLRCRTGRLPSSAWILRMCLLQNRTVDAVKKLSWTANSVWTAPSCSCQAMIATPFSRPLARERGSPSGSSPGHPLRPAVRCPRQHSHRQPPGQISEHRSRSPVVAVRARMASLRLPCLGAGRPASRPVFNVSPGLWPCRPSPSSPRSEAPSRTGAARPQPSRRSRAFPSRPRFRCHRRECCPGARHCRRR